MLKKSGIKINQLNLKNKSWSYYLFKSGLL